MVLAAEILDTAQEYLHDDGTLWTRAELLDYLNDACRRALTETKAIRALTIVPVPPRLSASLSYAWERQYTEVPCSVWTWEARVGGDLATAYAWEVEHLAGMATPASGDAGNTQPWERIYGTATGRSDLYPYPADHGATVRIAYDGERVWPERVYGLDQVSDTWETDSGTPLLNTGGTGGIDFFGLYQQPTGDGQQWTVSGVHGLPGTWSGDNTYAFSQDEPVRVAYGFTGPGDVTDTHLAGPGKQLTTDAMGDYTAAYAWEVQHLAEETVTAGAAYWFTSDWEHLYAGMDEWEALAGFGLPGMIAGATQYIPIPAVSGTEPLGTVAGMASATGNLLLDYSVASTTLEESDPITLFPAQMEKYLRAYVLSRAFDREGEGRQPLIAAFFAHRWTLGMKFLARLAQFAQVPRLYQAGRAQAAGHIAGRPRLPSHYPRVR